MSIKIGKAKYEKKSKNYFSFKKDQNTFVLRILPPMGDLAESGRWSIFHRVEFGHIGTDGRMKPFLSPRVVNYDGMVEVESQLHVMREGLKKQLLEAQTSGNTELYEQTKAKLGKYNQDAKHYMNAIDLEGNIGLFKLGHRGMQALKKEIERIKTTDGVDPLGIETGRFFVFSRSGKGRDTIYTVQEYKKKQEIDGPNGKLLVDVPFNHAIDDIILSKLETEAFELNKVYPSITSEEEARILNEGSLAVDQILGSRSSQSTTKNEASVSKSTTQSLDLDSISQNAQSLNGLSTQSTQENLEQTTLGGGYTTATEATSASLNNDVNNMSEEDFFKKIESGNF